MPSHRNPSTSSLEDEMMTINISSSNDRESIPPRLPPRAAATVKPAKPHRLPSPFSPLAAAVGDPNNPNRPSRYLFSAALKPLAICHLYRKLYRNGDLAEQRLARGEPLGIISMRPRFPLYRKEELDHPAHLLYGEMELFEWYANVDRVNPCIDEGSQDWFRTADGKAWKNQFYDSRMHEGYENCQCSGCVLIGPGVRS